MGAPEIFPARSTGIRGMSVRDDGLLLKVHHSTNTYWLKNDLSFGANKGLYEALGVSHRDILWVESINQFVCLTRKSNIIWKGNEQFSEVNCFVDYKLTNDDCEAVVQGDLSRFRYSTQII